MDESTSKCKFCGEKIFSPEEACPHCGKYEKGRLIITQSGWLQKFEPKEPVIGDGWYLYDHAKEDKKQFQKNMECICELLRQGEIDSSVLVCSTEDMEWKPLGECKEFQDVMKKLKRLPPPPPLPPSEMDNSYIWLLAFTPFWGTLLYRVLIGVMQVDYVNALVKENKTDELNEFISNSGIRLQYIYQPQNEKRFLTSFDKLDKSLSFDRLSGNEKVAIASISPFQANHYQIFQNLQYEPWAVIIPLIFASILAFIDRKIVLKSGFASKKLPWYKCLIVGIPFSSIFVFLPNYLDIRPKVTRSHYKCNTIFFLLCVATWFIPILGTLIEWFAHYFFLICYGN